MPGAAFPAGPVCRGDREGDGQERGCNQDPAVPGGANTCPAAAGGDSMMSHTRLYRIVTSQHASVPDRTVTSLIRHRWIDQVSATRPAAAGGLRADESVEAQVAATRYGRGCTGCR